MFEIVLLLLLLLDSAVSLNKGVFSLGSTIMATGSLPARGFNALQPLDSNSTEELIVAGNLNTFRCILMTTTPDCVPLPPVTGARTIADVNNDLFDDIIGTKEVVTLSANRESGKKSMLTVLVQSANVLPTLSANATNNVVELVAVVGKRIVAVAAATSQLKLHANLPAEAVQSYGLYGGDFDHDNYSDILHFYQSSSSGAVGAMLLQRNQATRTAQYNSTSNFDRLGFEPHLNYSFDGNE